MSTLPSLGTPVGPSLLLQVLELCMQAWAGLVTLHWYPNSARRRRLPSIFTAPQSQRMCGGCPSIVTAPYSCCIS